MNFEKNSIVQIKKTTSIGCFRKTETHGKFIFQRLYYITLSNIMNLNSLILEYILCDRYFFFFNKKSRKVSGLKIDSANSLYLIRVIQFYLSETQFTENVSKSLFPTNFILHSALVKYLKVFTLPKTISYLNNILNTLNLNYLPSKNKTINLESFRRK